VGQGFVFDGNTDAIQLGTVPNLQLQNFTVEAWVRRFSTTASSLVTPDAELFCFGANGFGFGMWNDGRLFLTKVGVDNAATTTGITDTNFHHVAVTKNGTTVTFYIDGVAQSVPSYGSVFTFSTPAAIGARGDNLNNSFYGIIDELAVYSRSLAGSEIQGIFNARGTGKCTTPTPPFIASQPSDQTVAVGNSAVFSVIAGGTFPLTYQWSTHGTNIPAGTGSSVTVTNVQFSDAGNYSVVVSNNVGSATSSNALLTVIPAPPCAALPAGIVSWWSGEGDASDSINGNSGTLQGGVSFTPGEVHQAFSFNGTSAYVSVPASSTLNVGVNGGLTIECWIKPADLTSQHALLEWNNEAGGLGVQLWISIPQYGGK
jgi:hypothetical protein